MAVAHGSFKVQLNIVLMLMVNLRKLHKYGGCGIAS